MSWFRNLRDYLTGRGPGRDYRFSADDRRNGPRYEEEQLYVQVYLAELSPMDRRVVLRLANSEQVFLVAALREWELRQPTDSQARAGATGLHGL